jgi:hypothetical protein
LSPGVCARCLAPDSLALSPRQRRPDSSGFPLAARAVGARHPVTCSPAPLLTCSRAEGAPHLRPLFLRPSSLGCLHPSAFILHPSVFPSPNQNGRPLGRPSSSLPRGSAAPHRLIPAPPPLPPGLLTARLLVRVSFGEPNVFRVTSRIYIVNV